MSADYIKAAEDTHAQNSGKDIVTDTLFETRNLSIELSAPLSDEDQVVQAADYASPTKWHLAHTTWFFEAFILAKYLTGYKRFNDAYEFCFNSYYNAVGPRHPRPQRGLLTRPSAQDVRNYRDYVDANLKELIEHYDDQLPEDLIALLKLGINHEQQHQELLLTDILCVFSQSPLYPSYKNPEPREVDELTQDLCWTTFEETLATIGYIGDDFSYDIEGPVHKQYIADYKIANRLVTNGEWLEFINDDAYHSVNLWLDDGWSTVQQEQWQAPLYWQMIDGEWNQMSLRGLQPINLSAPVTHISYYEADAFARWSGYRLPYEYEWENATKSLPINGNMIGSKAFRPLPASSDAKEEIVQAFGDVWEWTQSSFSPYPSYQPPKGAIGEYNGKFMSNKFVLRGGSCATPDGHIRHTYRNFFCPHERWQFMGLRLASDV